MSKDKILVESSSVEATFDLSEFLMQSDDLSIGARLGDSELENEIPIGSDSGDFDIEPSDDVFYDDGLDFEKCNEVAKSIIELFQTKGVRYREAVAILHKLNARIDPQGDDALDA